MTGRIRNDNAGQASYKHLTLQVLPREDLG